MDSIFFHIDVNSAFLSWSAIDMKQQAILTHSLDSYVDIRTIPAIIGGDTSTRHGIVLAKSILAKNCGISTAEPIVSAQKKCPGLTIVSPNHSSYEQHSKAFISYLSTFCPFIEQVSIDECYMDFTPIAQEYASPIEAANIIRESINNTFGFTVNVGISNQKVLAKMASDFKKPNLVHTLFTHEISAKMWPLPISSLFMCGKSSQEVLKNLGITTIGQLANASPALITSHLKSHGKLLWEYANGIDPSIVQTTHAPVKSIGNSTTMTVDAVTLDAMKPVILSLCESVSKRLRAAHSIAGTITVEIKYATFQSCSHQKLLSMPTNSSSVIYEVCLSLLEALWDKTPVRLLGVRATKLLEEDTPLQLDLFSYQESCDKTQKNQKLDETMDAIRRKYGDNAIVRASLLSMPNYTKKNDKQ